MTTDDEARFTRIIEGLGQTFNREITPSLAEVYFRALASIPIETVEAFAAQAIVESKFFPRPYEFHAFALEVQYGKPLSADEAWALVEEAFDKVGRYREFPEDTPGGVLLKRVVDGIGWRTLCNSENQEFSRSQFVKAFASYQESVRKDRLAGRQPSALLSPRKSLTVAPSHGERPQESSPVTSIGDVLATVAPKKA